MIPWSPCWRWSGEKSFLLIWSLFGSLFKQLSIISVSNFLVVTNKLISTLWPLKEEWHVYWFTCPLLMRNLINRWGKGSKMESYFSICRPPFWRSYKENMKADLWMLYFCEKDNLFIWIMCLKLKIMWGHFMMYNVKLNLK